MKRMGEDPQMTKKRKIGIFAFVCLAVLVLCWGGLVLYRKNKIVEPILTSEQLRADELTVTLRGIEEQNDYEVHCFTLLYQSVRRYLESAYYLPCLDQDNFAVGERSVKLRYQSDQNALTLIFYEGSGICQINGKKVYFFPKEGRGKDAYQKIEEIFETESFREYFTVAEVDREYNSLKAVDAKGDEYTFGVEPNKLRTTDEKPCTADEIQAGDAITVLWDGNVLTSYPYQIVNIYRIYKTE